MIPESLAGETDDGTPIEDGAVMMSTIIVLIHQIFTEHLL